MKAKDLRKCQKVKKWGGCGIRRSRLKECKSCGLNLLSRKSGHGAMKEIKILERNVIEMKAEDLRKCQKVKVGRMRDKYMKD